MAWGSHLQSIANALLSGGRANVPRLIQVTHQSPRTVKESLFILIQHGLVTFAETSEGGRRGIAYYEILPLRVLLRNQFPFYASAAKSLYGEEVCMLRYTLYRKYSHQIHEGFMDRS